MSAFKSLLASDIIVTPYEVSKGFSLYGSAAISGSGIDRFLGKNLTSSFSISDPKTGQANVNVYQRLIYNSVKQLYYSNYLSSSYGSELPLLLDINGYLVSASNYAPRYDNYLQTTLTFPRDFPTGSNSEIGVFSIPKSIFGDKIAPASLQLEVNSVILYDDGEGNILSNQIPGRVVGNITYAHGIVVLYSDPTDIVGGYGNDLYGTGVYGGSSIGLDLDTFLTQEITCSFSSSYTLYETQYKCTIAENEFTDTLNPTVFENSTTGDVYSYVTGSDFNPYITTVGLYSSNQELLAVGKLSQPLPTSRATDTTIQVNLDIV